VLSRALQDLNDEIRTARKRATMVGDKERLAHFDEAERLFASLGSTDIPVDVRRELAALDHLTFQSLSGFSLPVSRVHVCLRIL
jgi:hypothetical protein